MNLVKRKTLKVKAMKTAINTAAAHAVHVYLKEMTTIAAYLRVVDKRMN